MAEAAGIFVADDNIIFGHSSGGAQNLTAFDPPVIIDRFKASQKLENDLERAVSEIAASAQRCGIWKIDKISVALPGPVKVSGMRTYSIRQDLLINRGGSFGLNTRRREFSGVDVVGEIERATERSKQVNEVFSSYRSYIYHDAAAFAYGDYVQRKNQFKKEGRAGSDFDKSEIHALILLDEGVGGAFIAAGVVAQGPTHAEMGHICVPRHPDDFAFDAKCALHKRGDCLESFIGLPALRRRWGNDFLTRQADAFGDWNSDDPRLWMLAYYIANLLVTMSLIVAPTHVSLVGRVATGNPVLVRMVRGYYRQMLEASDGDKNIYPGYSRQAEPDFIEVVGNADTGIFGAIMLAKHSDRVAKIIGYDAPYNGDRR